MTVFFKNNQTFFRNLGLLSALIVLTTLQSCNNSAEDERSDNQEYHLSGDTVILDDNSIIKNRLIVKQAEMQEVSRRLHVLGKVKSIPNAYAEIASPFKGRVLKSFVQLGQTVSAGTPIFQLSSSDFFESQKNYYDAKEEYDQASLTLEREKDLFEHGVGVKRDLEEAQTNYAIKKNTLENAKAGLSVFQQGAHKIVMGEPLTVRSPIAGKVIVNNIVLGQFVKEDEEPLVVVADLKKVWIEGQVKEHDLAYIEQLTKASVYLDQSPDEVLEGEITHVNEVLDEDTRAVGVIVAVDNPNLRLKHGMYVNVDFGQNPKEYILIPNKAVFQKENRQFVFVRVGKDQYLKREVQGFSHDGDRIAVTSGLEPGEPVVVEGGSLMVRNY
ncbi:MAG TPA: efflux RND transporter periplasmic adaptor subunit [Candidatus Sphingobacterium stercoripullorum]|nr:efflux RND transporter periplasmic adaptor subunit [Candidatus Sphingobacterium stercoripullorum]